jgi:hypothetical protein
MYGESITLWANYSKNFWLRSPFDFDKADGCLGQ